MGPVPARVLAKEGRRIAGPVADGGATGPAAQRPADRGDQAASRGDGTARRLPIRLGGGFLPPPPKETADSPMSCWAWLRLLWVSTMFCRARPRARMVSMALSRAS